jgi:hypothetical protein
MEVLQWAAGLPAAVLALAPGFVRDRIAQQSLDGYDPYVHVRCITAAECVLIIRFARRPDSEGADEAPATVVNRVRIMKAVRSHAGQ